MHFKKLLASAVLVFASGACFAGSNGQWVAFGDASEHGCNDTIYASARTAQGDLIVGGKFTQCGGVAANHIARWNGSQWLPLGTGVDDWVRAIAVSGSTVYAGGDFDTAGGVAASRIARWSGNAWGALGAGVNDNVRAIFVDGKDVYVGGYFSNAGGLPSDANGIARWSTDNGWSLLGEGLGTVVTISVYDGQLYAGGYFFTSDDIMRWDGGAWVALGSGLTGSWVEGLAAAKDGLYVVGGFSAAGDVAHTKGAARWNGSWHALGTGLETSNLSTVEVSRGRVFVGGDFFTETANYIAQWDGSVWSKLGNGFGSPPQTMVAAAGGGVYVGGFMDYIVDDEGETQPSENIALWSRDSVHEDGFE